MQLLKPLGLILMPHPLYHIQHTVFLVQLTIKIIHNNYRLHFLQALQMARKVIAFAAVITSITMTTLICHHNYYINENIKTNKKKQKIHLSANIYCTVITFLTLRICQWQQTISVTTLPIHKSKAVHIIDIGSNNIYRIAVMMSVCLQTTVILTERSHRTFTYHCVRLIITIIIILIKMILMITAKRKETTPHLQCKAVMSEIRGCQCVTGLISVITTSATTTTAITTKMQMLARPVVMKVVILIVIIITILVCVMHMK